eukprot:500710_1
MSNLKEKSPMWKCISCGFQNDECKVHCQACFAKGAHFLASGHLKVEDAVIKYIKTNQNCLNDLEIDLYALQTNSLTKLKNMKLKQIESTRKKVIEEFGAFKQHIIRKMELHEQNMLNKLNKMEREMHNDPENEVLENAMNLLKMEQQKLSQTAENWNERQEISRIGDDTKRSFHKTVKSVKNMYEQFYQIKKNYEFNVKMDFRMSDYQKAVKARIYRDIETAGDIYKDNLDVKCKNNFKSSLCVYGFIRRIENFCRYLNIPLDIYSIIAMYCKNDKLIKKEQISKRKRDLRRVSGE